MTFTGFLFFWFLMSLSAKSFVFWNIKKMIFIVLSYCMFRKSSLNDIGRFHTLQQCRVALSVFIISKKWKKVVWGCNKLTILLTQLIIAFNFKKILELSWFKRNLAHDLIFFFDSCFCLNLYKKFREILKIFATYDFQKNTMIYRTL